MQILPNRYYKMIMRYKDWEKPGRCFHLRVVELKPEERKLYEDWKEEEIPTHKVLFYDFEYHRVLEGRIKENTEEKLIFEIGKGKEYEFSLLKPANPKY